MGPATSRSVSGLMVVLGSGLCQVLRFLAVWDDRDSLYGDLLRFKIHYYLVDDTMEIVPQFERNWYVAMTHSCLLCSPNSEIALI